MANGDTVASGNIKLGVDTTPMEQGLSAAKVTAAAQAQQVQAAVDSVTVGGDDSDAYQARLREMATQERRAMASERANAAAAAQRKLAEAEADRLRIAADLNRLLADAEKTTASTAANTAQAAVNAGGFAANVKNATAGFRGVASAITSTVGAVTGLAAVIGIVVGAVAAAAKSIENHFKALGDYARAATKAYEDYAKLLKSPLGGEQLNSHQRNIRQIYDERESRIKTAKAIYDEEVAAALNLSGEKRRAAVQDAEFNRKRAEQQIERMANKEIEALTKVQDRKDTAARQASADQDRAEAASGEKIGKIIQKLREDRAEARRVEEMETAAGARLAVEELVEDYRKAADVYRDAMRAANEDIARQQQAQLTQLRNDINALYSSGNLEVGIGRVASLLETLIAKTEGRR